MTQASIRITTISFWKGRVHRSRRQGAGNAWIDLMELDDQQKEELLCSGVLENRGGVPQTREQAEKELVRATERITNLLEGITDGFFALDREWCFTYLNRRCAQILEGDAERGERLLGKTFWETFPAALGSPVEENFRRAVQERQTVQFATSFGKANAWYEVRACTGPEGLSVFFHDISARRRAEQRFRAAFDHAAVGLAIASLDGSLEEANAKLAEILGCLPSEILGKTLLHLTHPLDVVRTQDNIRGLTAGEVSDYIQETRYLRKSGQVVWCLTSVTLLKDDEGSPAKFIAVVEDITQRKRAETAVREGAQRFQLALSAGHLGDWSWDALTDVLTLGPEGCHAFGLDPGTLITWTKLRERIHPEDQEKERRAVQDALSHQSDYHVQYRALVRGKYVWISANGRGVYAPEGTLGGMIGVIQDITDRKVGEEVRNRLAAVVESSDDAIISMSLDTTITTWNKGAEIMFGYTAAEAVGRSVLMLLPPTYEDEEPMIIQKLLRGERIAHYETVRARKDGTLLNVSLTVSPVYDSTQKIIGVSKISRDITDRKRAEEALRRSDEELRALANSIPHLAWMAHADGNIFWYNQRFYEYTGAAKAEMAGWGWQGAIEPEMLPKVLERWKESLRTGSSFDMEFPIRGADGQYRWFLSRAIPVRDDKGRVLRWFGTNTDVNEVRRAQQEAQREIAERKRMEGALREAQAQLQRHAEKLEDEVAERTARLRETIQELEAFSYSVSHDMRSPLRAMQGYADALLEDYSATLDATAADYLKRIRRAASRMDLLIQDVLAYSRVAKGEIQLEPVNLESVIHDVIQHYPSLQPERADIAVAAPLPPVLGHEAYLTQIVSNFLNNAVKFIPIGTKPRIHVRAERERGWVRISFEDNGIGIAPQHQTQIFQIFGRVYSEKKFEGTGIGLAIAKKAAERMGGSIGVRSELGKGSSFFVLLKEPV